MGEDQSGSFSNLGDRRHGLFWMRLHGFFEWNSKEGEDVDIRKTCNRFKNLDERLSFREKLFFVIIMLKTYKDDLNHFKYYQASKMYQIISIISCP